MKQFVLLFIGLITITYPTKKEILKKQYSFPNVKEAYDNKSKEIINDLNRFKIPLDSLNILYMVIKEDNCVKAYVKKSNEEKYKFLEEYDICVSSGKLGPKRKQGDLQVPEGYYHINTFNSDSWFFLSLGINYPNSSDKIKSEAVRLGGHIFFHGGCLSEGCIPLTDDVIKKVYLLTLIAKNSGQKLIPSYIFPFKMTKEKMAHYSENSNIEFWRNIKHGYDFFNSNKQEIIFSVDLISGDYKLVK